MTPTVNQSTRLRLGYGLAALLILVAEVLIALFVRDRFIRPYGGDILVTLLICCAIRVILPKGYRLPIGGGVLLFAILVEVGQYFGLVYRFRVIVSGMGGGHNAGQRTKESVTGLTGSGLKALLPRCYLPFSVMKRDLIIGAKLPDKGSIPVRFLPTKVVVKVSTL